jgi:hypothetical protein
MASLKKAKRHRLVKIIGFRYRWKKSRGSGASPMKVRINGRSNCEPRKIPAIQAKLREISDKGLYLF